MTTIGKTWAGTWPASWPGERLSHERGHKVHKVRNIHNTHILRRRPTLKSPVSPVDFLENEVLPALFERLDAAFPEFGWKRTSRGWTATDRDFTKTLTGARPGRVVC